MGSFEPTDPWSMSALLAAVRKAAALVVATMLAGAGGALAADFRLPFDGRWFVAQGGDTPNVNHHMRVRAQAYGVDFAKVGGPGERALVKTDGSTLEDFYCWRQPVLAPVEGRVLEVLDDLPDNALGIHDTGHPFGNHVVIRTADDRYVFLAHLMRHSIVVRKGDRVAAGTEVGRCGNSGNSDYPHVHMHVQDSLDASATGMNVTFSHIDVELSGKRFGDVDWPLIQGLFVANSPGASSPRR